MRSTPPGEATSGTVPAEIVEICHERAIKALLAQPHGFEQGTFTLNGKSTGYHITKPLPRDESHGGPIVHFEGVLSTGGKLPVKYTITRFNYPDGRTESFIKIDGVEKGKVIREPPPQTVTHRGTVEVQQSAPGFDYEIKHDGVLEKDELEAVLSQVAMNTPRPMTIADIVDNYRARRNRRLAKLRESDCDG